MKLFKGVMVALVVSAGLAGCSTVDKKMQVSNLTPASEGEITAKKQNANETSLKIEVKHLASPEKISPVAKNYVVWMQPQGQDVVQNLGTLALNENKEAKFERTVPFESFRVFVTPEADRLAPSPTGPVILDKMVVRQ